MLKKSVSRTLSQNRFLGVGATKHKRVSTSAGRSNDVPATAHTVATCGIRRWEPPKADTSKRKMKVELPSHLILPPCMPGTDQGKVQTCLTDEQAMYCVPCRIKYKYPSFSENIDFVPPQDPTSCWWQTGLACDDSADVGPLQAITKHCPMLEN